MINHDGLTAHEVAERLGVELATVYAYASRGSLTRRPAADGRASRYDPDEVELLARRARPRSSRRSAVAVDVVIGTTISEIGDGWIRYRGHDLADLAGHRSFEDVARLLWTGDAGPAGAPAPATAAKVRAAARRAAASLPSTSPVSSYLAVGAASVSSLLPSAEVDLAAVGLLLIDALVEALPLIGQRPGGDGVGAAARLWPRISPLVATPARIRALDVALVLLAEHELATSTLAVRVAASARARPAESVLAGLGAVSGPLHGRAAVHVHRRLLAPRSAPGPEAESVAGTGHSVHRRGDPRFLPLHAAVDGIAGARKRARIADDLHRLRRPGVAPPNVDAALGALGYVAAAEPGITEAIFAVSRTAGWLAHAFEETDEAPLRFRGRTLYRGPRP